MALTFQGPHLTAASGAPTSLVVFVHGYGASGDDLLSLGRQWRDVLPDSDFIAPHAPFVCDQNPDGFQWCHLQDWNPARITRDLGEICGPFNAFVDAELAKRGLGPERVAFVGFSLGTFMALEAALHRPRVAAVVGYAGGYVHDSSRLVIGRPPVILIHGKQDPVLSYESTLSAQRQLEALSVPVETVLLDGVEHFIDVQGLGRGAGFLKQQLD